MTPGHRDCEICGKCFRLARRRKDARFCDRKCYAEYQRFSMTSYKHWNWKGETTIVCGRCGKEFKVKKYRNQTAKYCSVKCQDGVRINLICEQCGKKFDVVLNRKHTARFCSRKCRGEWGSANLIGEASYCWRGGLHPYPPEFNEKFKRAIRRRDRSRCAICGNRGKDVHHIDYDKDNTIAENCIILCHSCHMGTNANREYWEGRLSDIMMFRTFMIEDHSILAQVPEG